MAAESGLASLADGESMPTRRRERSLASPERADGRRAEPGRASRASSLPSGRALLSAPARSRRADRLVAVQGARDGRRNRARSSAGAGARRRRQRRPAARRHEPRAGERARRVPDAPPSYSVSTLAVDAPEGAERRHPGRSLDGPARRRRQPSSRAASTPCSAATSATATTSARRAPAAARDALRRAAAQDLDRLVHGGLRARDPRAERELRRRGRRRARAGVLQGADALGAVRARHVGLARSRRRQGVRDDAGRRASRRGRGAAGVRRARQAARRPGRDVDRRRHDRRIERDAHDGARPDLAAVAAHGQAARHRGQPRAARAVRALAPAGARRSRPSSPCSAPAPRSASTAASGAASRTRCSRCVPRASAGRPPSSSSSRCRAPSWACGTGTCATTASMHNEVVRAQLGYAPGELGDSRRRLAQPRPSRRCGAPDLSDRVALPARDHGLRMRVPGPPQGRPLGLAAQPRQGRRARQLRQRPCAWPARTWT